tara:strand:- start:1679 stop:2056 length:378 start_codon:yes stop_codon:yes gene_type:complete
LARYNYFGFGDHFSEFHRKHDGISGIDLDFVETCPRCKEPLAFFETAFDKGQTFKATTTTEWIARKCGKPSFLVFYKPGEKMDEIEVFRVQILTPERSEQYFMRPEEFINMLRGLQDKHKQFCKG